jgi:hypothetical protein
MIQQELHSDFLLLAEAANFIKEEFICEHTPWVGSPFEWVRSLSSGSKGKLGKRLVSQWCALKGFTVNPSPDSDADLLVNGRRVEIKFSTLWQGGFYKFQQVRDQNYEYAILLGISPSTAHCWVLSKQTLQQYVIGHLGQHTGSKGKDTSWITVNPNNPPIFMLNYGGTLDQAYNTLRQITSRRLH